jgi:hypothetical protein
MMPNEIIHCYRNDAAHISATIVKVKSRFHVYVIDGDNPVYTALQTSNVGGAMRKASGIVERRVAEVAAQNALDHEHESDERGELEEINALIAASEPRPALRTPADESIEVAIIEDVQRDLRAAALKVIAASDALHERCTLAAAHRLYKAVNELRAVIER